jgi:hypothetical protein
MHDTDPSAGSSTGTATDFWLHRAVPWASGVLLCAAAYALPWRWPILLPAAGIGVAPETQVLAAQTLCASAALVMLLALQRLHGVRTAAAVLADGHAARRRQQLMTTAQAAWASACLLGLTHVGLTAEAQLTVAVRKDAAARGLVALGTQLPVAYLGQRALPYCAHDELDERWLRRTLQTLGAKGPEVNRFVFNAKDREASELMLILEGLSCTQPQVFEASLPQRLGYGLRPGARGSGTLLLYRCSGSDLAQLQR